METAFLSVLWCSYRLLSGTRANSPSAGHGWVLKRSNREFRQILLVFHISEVCDPEKSPYVNRFCSCSCLSSSVCRSHPFYVLGFTFLFFQEYEWDYELYFYCQGFSVTKDGSGGRKLISCVLGWEYLCVYPGALGSVVCETTAKFRRLSCVACKWEQKRSFMWKSLTNGENRHFFNGFGSITA